MCFSAPVSFTVSSVLGVTGALSMDKVMKSRKMLLALIPVFFGIQQFSEGIVWLSVDGTISQSIITNFFTNLYLFFAWSFWPFYIPLSVIVAEDVLWKKVLFAFVLFIGTFVMMHDVFSLINSEVSVAVRGNSLLYGRTTIVERLVYVFTILVPLLLSSVRRLWVFGLLVGVSFVISHWIYHYAFTSVWCFFAAVVSFVLLMIL